MSSWDEMLDEFRALGGVADNICLKQGAYGRGLFPIDPTKPIQVRIPESLLLNDKFIRIENGAFRIAEDAEVGARERRFLEQYERDFSWGVGHQETLALLQMMHEAPSELRDLLQKSFGCERWIAEPTLEAVQNRFFASRSITHKDNDVIMPIVELANHGHNTQYRNGTGVGLEGRFGGEILVRYQLADPLHLFNKWGFVSENESFALSLAMRFQQEARSLVIGRHMLSVKSAVKPFVPIPERASKTTKLPFLLAGHKRSPRLPRGIFNRLMRDGGAMRGEAEETFDVVQHLNRTEWYKLIRLCDEAAPELARLLRHLAVTQLELMSYYGGSSEI